MLTRHSRQDRSKCKAAERPRRHSQGVERPTHRIAVLIVIMALALTACGGGTAADGSDPTEGPTREGSESPPPTDSPSPAEEPTPVEEPTAAEVLEAISLPRSRAEIKATLRAMPDEVAGRAKAFVSLPLLRSGYGEGKHEILILAYEAFNLDLNSKTAGEVVPLFAEFDSMSVDASALDLDGEVVFFVGAELPGGPGQFRVETPIAFFGEPDSRWVFVAIADTAESLAALIEAFSIATNSGG